MQQMMTHSGHMKCITNVVNKTSLAEHTIHKTVGTLGPAYAAVDSANSHRQTKDMMQTGVH